MHDATHEARLEALLVGDLDPRAPEARALLESCPECRRAWAGMQLVTRGLDELASPEEQVLQEAGELRRAPGEREAESALRGAITQAGAARGARRRAWPLLLAAAALLLLALSVQLWLRPPAPDRPHDVPLGSEREFSPRGACDALFPLTWTREFEPGERPGLQLETRPEGTGEWTRVYDAPLPPGKTWAPSEEVRRACGRRIRYRIVLTVETQVLPGPWVEAWLR